MLLKPLLFEAILALLASEVLQQLPVSSYPQLIIAARSFIIKQSPFKRCLDSTLRPMLEFLRMAFAGSRVGLDHPGGSLSTQGILWFYESTQKFQVKINYFKKISLCTRSQGKPPICWALCICRTLWQQRVHPHSSTEGGEQCFPPLHWQC